MAQVTSERMSFEEFVARAPHGRRELVDGSLEELVPPQPAHGWTAWHFPLVVGPRTKEADPAGYWGGEVDIPTLPYHGRRPDFVYYSSADRERVDVEGGRVLGAPTLAVEILSEGDEHRDLVEKRREYAQAGIRHYWIVDPERRSVTTLVLRNETYETAGEFAEEDHLTSELFPGVRIPLSELFPR